ncbi:hypothetical protein Hypma_000451 [Hypsizygus marmoreus]|uniref:Uncharacterized protein n=1 Tax=Hypsizygus marmoreus TaxID=39966 RepID=A0A369J833_HYPMA|nr:hypothetical protein Hypma_000451 [Hypsizygus marmoreus]
MPRFDRQFFVSVCEEIVGEYAVSTRQLHKYRTKRYLRVIRVPKGKQINDNPSRLLASIPTGCPICARALTARNASGRCPGKASAPFIANRCSRTEPADDNNGEVRLRDEKDIKRKLARAMESIPSRRGQVAVSELKRGGGWKEWREAVIVPLSIILDAGGDSL